MGGGLAGLTAAIHLSKYEKSILLIEKNTFPKHKVCGEYISNEVLPYLNSLGIDPIEKGAKKISNIELSTVKGNSIRGNLPLGGFGMSRYSLDAIMANKALENGVTICQDTVEEVIFENDIFEIITKSNQTFNSKITIGAYGKRANLDIKMDRKFIKKRSPYMAVKMHVKGDFPEDKVALHNFKGGYCGVSKVESDAINLCYIANVSSFKKVKNISDFETQVLSKNRHLGELFENSTLLFDKPLVISQISFETKSRIDRHMLMCGDTAGMIHPLCGNGMSMAIRSAQMASEEVLKFLNEEITRDQLENNYLRNWNKEFKVRLQTGHFIAWLFRNQIISEILLGFLKIVPFVLTRLIRFTHGKPLKPL